MSEDLPAETRPALDFLATELQGMPGLNPIGLYVTGSAAMGDYQPHKSDLDFIAVTTAPLNSREIGLLQNAHRKLARKFPERVSGRYVAREALARRDEKLDQHIGFDKGRRMSAGMARLTEVCRYEVATHTLPIFGPDAREFAAPADNVALQRFVRANMQSYWMDWVRKSEGAHPFNFLTLAFISKVVEWGVLGVSRQLYTLREGGVTSKTGGGRYALEQVPPEYHKILRESIRIRARNGAREFHNPWSRRNAALSYMRHIFGSASLPA